MDTMYDAVIVGGGPAGLSAAMYLARAKYKVLVLEKEKIGGQITITADVVNYPGVKSTSGKALTDTMHEQAEAFGAEFQIAEVLDLDLGEDVKVVHTTAGDIKALSVVLALGANPRKVGFAGEKEFQGRGIAYCATCDGEFFSGMDIFVIGGGFAAVEESIFLTKYAKSVTICVRKDHFACAQTVADELKEHPKIKVLFNTEVVLANGPQLLSHAEFKNNKTGETWSYDSKDGESFGIFVFAGYVPNTGLVKGKVDLNEQGYVLTDENHQTNVPGVYAAGDVCVKNLRQVVTAVSDGAIAATAAEKVILALHKKLNLPEFSRPAVNEARLHERQEAISSQPQGGDDDTQFISNEIRAKLAPVFDKFAGPVKVKAWLDDSSFSAEIKDFLSEISSLTDKIEGETAPVADGKAPGLELFHADGTPSGIVFHSVPGGHEFNSFILALYNVASQGQAIDSDVQQALAKINDAKKPVQVDIMVSLSCTMCPEVVMGAQRLAAASPYIHTDMYDLQHFPDLKSKYHIMSVPCMIINGKDVHFGKKSIQEIAALLQ